MFQVWFDSSPSPPRLAAAGIFGGEQGQKKDDEALVAQLYQQIGRLKVERGFLESALGR